VIRIQQLTHKYMADIRTSEWMEDLDDDDDDERNFMTTISAIAAAD